MKKKYSFISCLFLTLSFAHSQNVGVGITTPVGKLHIKGAADAPQLIIDGHSTQSNTAPLIKLRNSLGNDLIWIHSDDSTNIFMGLHAGRVNNSAAAGLYNTFIGSDAGYSNTTGDYNTASGNHALFSNNTGQYNTANGSAALFSNTTGANNTATGSYSLSSNTSGAKNTTNGYGSLFSNTTGTNNAANGFESLFSNSTGFSNVAIGARALFSNTSRNNLVAIGDSALYANGQGAALPVHATNNTGVGSKSLMANTTGFSNTAIGYQSLKSNTSGPNNTALGTLSMSSNTTGSNSVAIGTSSLQLNTTGQANVALGSSTLRTNTTGSFNAAMGFNALNLNTTGTNNSAIGHESLKNNLTGKSNTAIGYRAMVNNASGTNNLAMGDSTLLTTTTGNNNTAIGRKANVSAPDISNATAIGSNAYAGSSNSVVIGSINGINGATANVNVGVGTTTPHASAVLEIKSTDKGILVPRVALSALNSSSPVSSPADALLIYNTASSGTGSNSVTPGFYHWCSQNNKWRSLNAPEENAGFGSWGDCSMNNVSEYNPIAADDGSDLDLLGSSVSISGNFAISGASEDYPGSNFGQGAAYMYAFNGGQWTQTQKIVASDGGPSDYFGYSVGISGNYAIIGAFDDNIGGNEGQGSVYIFFYNGTSWIQQQKLIASDGAPFDAFGLSVSIDGIYAAIGAHRVDVTGITDQGAVYVFKFNGTSWVQEQKLLSSDPTLNQFLGVSVCVKDNRIIAGTSAIIGGNASQGSAYVFSLNGVTWSQQQKLTASDGAANDLFGISVAIDGNNVVVGSMADDIMSSLNQGSAYLYNYNGTTWSQKQKLISSDGASDDNFGYSVSVDNNYIIVGSNHDDTGSTLNQGSAYIYQYINGLWMLHQKLMNPAGGADHDFGFAISISDTRFIIGSPGVETDRGIVVFGKIK